MRICGAASDVDRQVFTVRGCVGLFAASDLTPIPERRHRLRTRRPRSVTSNIDSKGKQRPVKGGGAGRTQGMFALVRRIRLRRAVRRISALLRSHQQGDISEEAIAAAEAIGLITAHDLSASARAAGPALARATSARFGTPPEIASKLGETRDETELRHPNHETTGARTENEQWQRTQTSSWTW